MTILNTMLAILVILKQETMPQRFFTVIIILGSNMIKKLSILVVGLVLVGGFVFADTAEPQEDFVYLFHLYYDNGQLFADRDFQFKYDVVPETFISETLTTQFPYRGEVVNL